MAYSGYGCSDEEKMKSFKQMGISGYSVRHCPQCKQNNLIVTSYANSKVSDCKCNNCDYRCVGMEGFVKKINPTDGKCCFFCTHWDRVRYLTTDRNTYTTSYCNHPMSSYQTAPYMTCDQFNKEEVKDNGKDISTRQTSNKV
jgi:hypothetical protein